MSEEQEMLFGGEPEEKKSAKKASAKKPPVEPDEAPDEVSEPATGTRAHHALDVEHGPLRQLVDFNFLQYASYVICDRAIPNVEDGLKPVQRRIMHALSEKDDGRFIKVANVVGHTMQYHPHGDASIADALVNLANKEYLIEGQGNFGNVLTGDRAAASRYIECRLTPLAREEMFNDELTEFVPSYDGRNREPVTLPCKLPLLLMLGAEGIAVGLSTRIFPHNFVELIEAQIAILNKKKYEILPDFPQGGLLDASEYAAGNGRLRVRARIREKDPATLTIAEVPFGQTTESLIASIEDAIRAGKVPVKSISDFTAGQVEIELTLAAGADLKGAMKALYAFTACESAMTGRVVVIRGNRPVEMDVRQVLEENTQRMLALLKAELTHRRHQLFEELHAKTLIQLFVENRIYKRIEECKTAAEVEKAVFDGLAPFRDKLRRDVTRQDVEMLLGVRIRRISLFDINRHRKEIDDIVAELERIGKYLADLKAYAIRYLKDLLKKHGSRYPRRTELTTFGTIAVRELTARELTIRYDRGKGYLGSAVEGETLLECSSYDKIVLVWRNGTYKVMPPPDKLFVDATLIYCALHDRDRVITLVYRWESFTMLKRFTFGGAIMNKEYGCALPDSEVLFFADDDPAELYVRYKPSKNQRIHQQLFRPRDIPVKGVQARGNQMTVKVIDRVSATRPRWWQDDDGPRGVL